MRNGMAKGKQSLGFAEAPYLLSAGTIVGQKESQGPLGKLFDERGQDKNNLFGKTTWEEAESEMQKRACLRAVEKSGIPRTRSAISLEVIFCGRVRRRRWESRVSRSLCSDFLGPVRPPVRHWLWRL